MPTMKESSTMERFVENTNAIREAKGLSIQALADLIGMRRPDLSDLLSGKHSPTLQTLERIAKGLGVDSVELIAQPRRSRRKLPIPA